ncbi:MAG: VCBS repeat-containing protein [Bacteroidota bacterium]
MHATMKYLSVNLFFFMRIFILIWLISFTFSCKRKSSETLFHVIPSAISNIHFSNDLKPDDGLNILDYNYFYNGGGVSAADFNNDGLTDLFFTGNKVSSKLYLNKGNFKFEDITEIAGVSTKNWATGIAVADVNNDGLQDMYISYAGYANPDLRVHQLFINKGIDKNGIPIFNDEAAAYGLADTSYTTQAVFLDYDKDGDLDLLLANHYQDMANPNKPKPILNDGSSSSNAKLYRNDNGHFKEVSKTAGILSEGYSLGVVVSDINNDGWPDIYFSKDFAFDDALYINNKNGTFTESIKKYVQHTSRFSMGCDIADYNNDSYPDIFTADMMPDDNERQKMMNIAMNNDRFNYALRLGYLPQYSRNMLQLNNGPDVKGNYSFSEIGQLAGVYKTDWSWSALFADLDNDGWKDLYITNGIPHDITNNDFINYRSQKIMNRSSISIEEMKKDLLSQIEKLKPVDKPNYVFANNKDLSFSDKSEEWGLAEKGMSNGAVYVDLDNDGDLDIVTNNLNSEASVFRNSSTEVSSNHFIRIKLTGQYAFGAKIFVKSNGLQQFIEHNPCHGFQSSQDPIEHFGLGKDSIIDKVKVVWLDGKEQTMQQVKCNQLLNFNYSNAKAPTVEAVIASKPQSIFTDITELSGIDFTQHQSEFEDFNFEPLLPHRFSRNGPYVCVGDVDKNGLDDIWIGGAAKIAGKLMLQQNGGKFLIKDMPDPGYEDMGGAFFDADNDGDLDLYVVSGGNVYNPATPTYEDRLYLNDGKGDFVRSKDALPKLYSSGSVVVVNDFDKDGDLDLFVGGRVVPTKYPTSPQSYLLRNNGKGQFEDITAQVCPEIGSIGMVTSAIFTDYNNDGYADLIVAGEWMPVTIFKNERGIFKKLTNNPLMQASTGWWFSLAAADMDNDGDMDFVAGNLGLNSKYGVSPSTPISVYVKDFDGNGFTEPILTYFLKNKEYTIAGRDQIASVMPSIKKQFETYSKFAAADFNQVFPAEKLEGAAKFSVTNFSSVYIENKGNDRFEMHPLPIQAQFSAVQSIQLADYDKDGKMDILLAGNFHSPDFMTGRYDASIGLMLKGDGKGGFKPLSPTVSGIHINGDARALATLKISNETVVIAAVNEGKLQVYKLNK